MSRSRSTGSVSATSRGTERYWFSSWRSQATAYVMFSPIRVAAESLAPPPWYTLPE